MECENEIETSNHRATGTIWKPFIQYVINIPGKQEIKELKKNRHFGHCTQTAESANETVCLFVFLSLHHIVVVFSQPGSRL